MPDQNTNAVDDAAMAAIQAAEARAAEAGTPADVPAEVAPIEAASIEDAPIADAPVDDVPAPEVVADSSRINAVAEIIEKINESKYILVALSGGPSIDELSAAIGLTTYLNKIGKRATAIYSGGMPDALAFLEVGDFFDHSADVLQDFVISLDKDKADHLRYKPEGDDIKIFITPYREKVSSDDLEFSYGDFNVDLVIALNVTSGIDLDEALREYGRIMQDATIVNIAASRPGKLGDIEWSNPGASSVSEMTAHLIHELGNEVPVEKEEATAFFAGIVSATNRFSNASTTPFTLTVSSWLMECGANQQLVAENITSDLDNQLFTSTPVKEEEPANSTDMEISHEEDAVEDGEAESDTSDALADLQEIQNELNGEQDLTVAQPAEAPVEVAPVETAPAEVPVEAAPVAEAPVAEPVVAAPAVEAPVASEAPVAESPIVDEDGTMNTSGAPIEVEHTDAEETTKEDGYIASNKETVIAVPESFNSEAPSADDNSRFGKMLEDALAGGSNPATAIAPTVAPQQEINGVPEINYAAAANVDILPPPPAPTGIPGMPEMPPTQLQPMPAAQPVQPAQPIAQPAPAAPQMVPQAAPAPEQLIQSRPPVQLVPPQPTAGTNPGIADPGAFRIPGM